MPGVQVHEKIMDLQPRGKFRCLLVTASSLSGLSFLLILNKSLLSWIGDWFKWCPTSTQLLEEGEMKMFSYLKKPCELSYVPINTETDECKIRSLIAKKDAKDKAIPLVLLHGFASGIGLWVLNIDKLSQDRPLYALDILGFGLSSRPVFSKDAEIAETQFIESIEQWRKQVGLNQFILLGHSMGGFLAASYAIKYPERIKHLILADPWGFPTPDLTAPARRIDIPAWAKFMAALLRPFNPLAILRAVGPWGPKLIQRLRPDILQKFENVVSDTSDVSNYIYHCNAQYPSGEVAFKAMTAHFGFANRPMIQRIAQLRQDIPITFIFGSRSWIDSSTGLQTTALRENSYVEIKIIEGAGHHVYADKADEFNQIVCNICKIAEKDQASVLYTSSQLVNNTSIAHVANEEACVAESI